MSVEITALLLFLGMVLLSFFVLRKESFIGSPDAQRCGVDLPPCPQGQTCWNGYCNVSTPPQLPIDTGLPVLP